MVDVDLDHHKQMPRTDSLELTCFPGSSRFRSFIPGGINHVPGKMPNPVLASVNWPGSSPSNALLMNFARMPFGKKYDDGKRYQSFPKQTLASV